MSLFNNKYFLKKDVLNTACGYSMDLRIGLGNFSNSYSYYVVKEIPDYNQIMFEAPKLNCIKPPKILLPDITSELFDAFHVDHKDEVSLNTHLSNDMLRKIWLKINQHVLLKSQGIPVPLQSPEEPITHPYVKYVMGHHLYLGPLQRDKANSLIPVLYSYQVNPVFFRYFRGLDVTEVTEMLKQGIHKYPETWLKEMFEV